MKQRIILVLAFFILFSYAKAQTYIAKEDTSRFTEERYQKALPGMFAPSVYVEMAKKAIRDKGKGKIPLRLFSDALVSHRIYRNAPLEDRDIVAVQFVYEGELSGGGMIGPGFIIMNEAPPVPVLQALIRKNGSKIYLNFIHYKNANSLGRG